MSFLYFYNLFEKSQDTLHFRMEEVDYFSYEL